MEKLSKFLERFSKILNKDKNTKEAIVKIIKNSTGLNLDLKNINLKDGVLEIEASPVAKNEIVFKESEIKDFLRSHQILISRIFYK